MSLTRIISRLDIKGNNLVKGINLEGLSDSAQYKLAGNGWDINMISKIFKALLKDYI